MPSSRWRYQGGRGEAECYFLKSCLESRTVYPVSRVHGFYLDPYNLMIQAGHVAFMGKRRGSCRVYVVKLEEKRPLGGPEYGWG
jgi:hypothetical protein